MTGEYWVTGVEVSEPVIFVVVQNVASMAYGVQSQQKRRPSWTSPPHPQLVGTSVLPS